MSYSLRGLLVRRTCLASALVLLVAGLMLWQMIRREVIEQFDTTLRQEAELMSATVEYTALGFEIDVEDLDMSEFSDRDGGGFLWIWASDGRILFESPSSAGNTAAPPARLAEIDETPPVYNLDLPTSGKVRACVRRFLPRVDMEEIRATDPEGEGPRISEVDGGAMVTLMLARSTVVLDRHLANLGALIGASFSILLLSFLAIFTVIIGKGLEPVARIANRIGELDELELSARVSGSSMPLELAPVAEQLNSLLGRLEQAFLRERTLSANIAHELRTPLAGLRSTLEVALLRDRDGGEYRTTLSEMLVALGHLENLVENLLGLARLDAGAFERETRELDLDRLAQELWREGYAERAEKRGLLVAWGSSIAGVLHSDPVLLESVLRNLFDNAVSHCKSGGRISISLSRSDRHVAIEISNSCGDLQQAEVDTLFDRFHRGDRARAVDGRHFGLGLALVKEIALSLAGDVELSVGPPGTFRIRLQVRDDA